MKKLKVTLITTVKNEQYTIESFLESIKSQVKKPDEVIIVDGGSNDKTIEKIKSYESKIQNLKIIKKKGNRSVGRNTAIKKSLNQIIAVTDVGCILDKNWLEKIIQPFTDESIDVVSGFYKPKTHGVFEKCLATYTCTMEDKLDKKNFLPSSRSIAFRKKAWEKIKGYPEYLDTCEDLVFAKNLKKAGCLFYTQEKALVYWKQRKNIYQALKQFYSYAKGDGEAHFFRKTTPYLFGRYLIAALFILYMLYSHSYFLFPIFYFLFILYCLWAIKKNYKYVKNIRAIIYLPLLQIVSDVAVISGTSLGFFLSLWKKL